MTRVVRWAVISAAGPDPRPWPRRGAMAAACAHRLYQVETSWPSWRTRVSPSRPTTRRMSRRIGASSSCGSPEPGGTARPVRMRHNQEGGWGLTSPLVGACSPYRRLGRPPISSDAVVMLLMAPSENPARSSHNSEASSRCQRRSHGIGLVFVSSQRSPTKPHTNVDRLAVGLKQAGRQQPSHQPDVARTISCTNPSFSMTVRLSTNG